MAVAARERYNARQIPRGPFTPEQQAWLRQELQAIQRGIPHGTVIDFRDYNPRLNGTSDESTALQRALRDLESTGLRLFLPPGTIAFVTPLLLRQTGQEDQLSIIGGGLRRTILKYMGTGGTALTIGDTDDVDQDLNTGPNGFLLRDFEIRDGATGAIGLLLNGVSNCDMQRLQVSSFDIGLSALEADVNTAHACRFTSNGVGVKLDDGSNQWTLTGCELVSNSTRAVSIERGSSGAAFYGCQFVSTTSTEHVNIAAPVQTFAPSASVYAAKLSGCWFEGRQSSGIDVYVGSGGSGSVRGVKAIGNMHFGETDGTSNTFYKVDRAGGTVIAFNSHRGNLNGQFVDVTANATDTYVVMNFRPDTTKTLVTDAGTRTFIINQGAGGALSLDGSSVSVATDLDVSGALDAAGIAHSFGSNTGASQTVVLNGAAATNRGINIQSAGVNRWIVRANTDAESGSNAGSNFEWVARADDGSLIDIVCKALRVAGGVVTWERPQAYTHLSAAQITGDQNDYAPTGQGKAVWRLSSDASRNVTGIANGAAGRALSIINVGAQNIVLQNQNTGSAEANRIITGTGADITIAADDVVNLWYDGTTARWRVTSHY